MKKQIEKLRIITFNNLKSILYNLIEIQKLLKTLIMGLKKLKNCFILLIIKYL
jgi:hypothetical protein